MLVRQPNGLYTWYHTGHCEFQERNMSAEEAIHFYVSLYRTSPSSAQEKLSEAGQAGNELWNACMVLYRHEHGLMKASIEAYLQSQTPGQ